MPTASGVNLVLDTEEPAEGFTGRPGRAAGAGCVPVGGIVVLFLACVSDLLPALDHATFPWLHLLSPGHRPHSPDGAAPGCRGRRGRRGSASSVSRSA